MVPLNAHNNIIIESEYLINKWDLCIAANTITLHKSDFLFSSREL